jgi:hypothetical protein
LYDEEKLLRSSLNFDEVKAYAHTPLGVIECGKVIWRAFDHDDRSKTSVDAAYFIANAQFRNKTYFSIDYISRYTVN